MLSKARHFVPEDKLLSIYYAIFSSHMIFGCQTWGLNSSTSHFKKIITLQKRAMRIMTFSQFNAHTEPLFKKLGILKMKDPMSLFNCLFIHDQTRMYSQSASKTTLLLVSTCIIQTQDVQVQCTFHLYTLRSMVVNLLKSHPSIPGIISVKLWT